MSNWFDNQVDLKEGKAMEEKKQTKIEIQLPGQDEWIQINKNQVKRRYADDLGGALLIVVDEVAELLTPNGGKSEAAKEEDELKNECVMLIQSITQLGRSAGIHMLLATQRNDAKIIPGVIQNNCQMRMVCGRLGRVASMMALESTLATTIDGERKGAGIISSNGIIEHIQYYFAPQTWIEGWFAKRGLTNKGQDPSIVGELDDDILEEFAGEEELVMNREKTEIDFAGIQGTVDKSEDQKFKEIQY